MYTYMHSVTFYKYLEDFYLTVPLESCAFCLVFSLLLVASVCFTHMDLIKRSCQMRKESFLDSLCAMFVLFCSFCIMLSSRCCQSLLSHQKHVEPSLLFKSHYLMCWTCGGDSRSLQAKTQLSSTSFIRCA